jgi:drug/metabolite transporter superfamily protein YnfA
MSLTGVSRGQVEVSGVGCIRRTTDNRRTGHGRLAALFVIVGILAQSAWLFLVKDGWNGISLLVVGSVGVALLLCGLLLYLPVRIQRTLRALFVIVGILAQLGWFMVVDAQHEEYDDGSGAAGAIIGIVGIVLLLCGLLLYAIQRAKPVYKEDHAFKDLFR